MQDIGQVLQETMRKEQCSSLRAFFILSEDKEKQHGIYILQSESDKKTGR